MIFDTRITFIMPYLAQTYLHATFITAMGCHQCLPLSVVQLKGKHFQKTHCRNGVVDTFEKWGLTKVGYAGWTAAADSGRVVSPPTFTIHSSLSI